MQMVITCNYIKPNQITYYVYSPNYIVLSIHLEILKVNIQYILSCLKYNARKI